MSKSRVFYFNPTCELAVANGSFSYMPPQLLREMECDLSMLPFVFADEQDFVLVEQIPSSEFIRRLAEAGFSTPGFLTLTELEAKPFESFDSVLPWGWSPAAHWKLKTLKDKCSGEFKNSPVADWLPTHFNLYERATSLEFLRKFLMNHPEDWLMMQKEIGQKVFCTEEIEKLLALGPLVLKAPLSSSGRGIQIVRQKKLNTSNCQWISGILKQQGYVIAEPFLEKKADLSFQFQILPDSEVEYLGFSFFETSSNGQYKSTFIRPDLSNLFPRIDYSLIEKTAKMIQKELVLSDYASYHRGYLGVDALIFERDKQLLIQPCIEINCRMNMGILSLKLEQKIHQEAFGKFSLFYGKRGEYNNFASHQQQLYPPITKDGKLISGFFPLTEPREDKKFGAYITLGAAR